MTPAPRGRRVRVAHALRFLRETLTPRARFCAACGAPAPDAPADDDAVRVALQRALGTHFRIERLLGQGGMGAVYLAHETGLDRHVAIKTLPPDRAGTPDSRERFRREARTAARLAHPNIVPLHAFGEEDSLAYYVMGYVDGESLETRLRRDGPLPEPEACRILADVARALGHAHLHGVVHRDVKPANILIEADTGRVVLTDFGIARADEATLTMDGVAVGTPDFMSPEQAAGQRDIGPASDVYSLGLTGYLMLAGRLPFDEAMAARAGRRRPVPLGTLAPGVSSRTATALMRCLEDAPTARWPDADAFTRALEPDDEDDVLPEPLMRVERLGLVTMGTLYVAMFLSLLSAVVLEPGPIMGITTRIARAIAALLALAAGLAALALRRRGFAGRAIAAALFQEPTHWVLWYPAPFRRPTNIWERLPRHVRRVRAFLNAVVGFTLGVTVPFGSALLYAALDLPNARTEYDPIARALLMPVALLTALGLASFVVWSSVLVRRYRRAGLSELEASQLVLYAPPSRVSFWRRPAIAALLGPPAPIPAAPREVSIPTRTAAGPR